ncbi:hypothetical protein JTE90_000130 [Oedothorax gibbosus]|uniref:Acyl-CoA synthetase family member 4 n=1 Tax=Oedothorax gibbosus TaxID=931172 RepID=A0AAV6UZS9_9ARAC|nr:hypothetical protein JTE90_000130 [Oedothorax gibbosus]
MEIPLHSAIGCLVKPSVALPALILGISKISSPFMFLDISDPVSSLKSLQKYASVGFLLVNEALLKDFKEKLCVCWSEKRTISSSNFSSLVLLKSVDCTDCPASKLYPDFSRYVHRLSYIIQTSGTTGTPKIVQVPHQCIVPNIIDLGNRFNINSDDVLLMCSPLSFDPSIVEIFLAIVSGCTLVIVPNQMKCLTKRLCDVIVDSKVTVIQATPSLFKSLSENFIKNTLLSKESKLRVLAFGGEVCPSLNKLRMWKSSENQTLLFNLYGVTEISCWASCYLIDLKNETSSEMLLGDPLLETNIELNENGEVLIGGNKRWCLVDDESWPQVEMQFMRRTGDFAIKTAHGLHFLGRKDKIIKYNGQKLFLQNISDLLENMPEIVDHYVYFDQQHSKIILFVVYEVYVNVYTEGRDQIIEALRLSISNLPAVEVVTVPFIPLTKNGKADCVKMLEFSKLKEQETRNSLEANYLDVISILWKSFTKVSTISEDDNFIMSGGDSFSAVYFACDIKWKLQIFSPELVEKLLNDSFKDIIKHVEECLTEKNASKPCENYNVLVNKNCQGPVFKKACLENSECYETATRRGYSLKCVHSKEGISCRKEEKFPKNTSICLRLNGTFDLKKCVDASPCVSYFFQSDKLLAFIGSHSGLFSCINVNAKELEWTTKLPDRIESSSSTTFCGKYVLVGCYDCYLYCMEIETGIIKWKLETGGEIKSSPVVSSENIAYFGSRDKYLYAVQTLSGQLVWKQVISNGSIFSSPALCTENKCLAVSTLDGVFAVLKMDTGNIVWTFNHGKPLFSSPVFTSTSIYIGSTNNCLLKFDLSGNLVTEHHTNGPVFSSPAKNESKNKGHIVFGCHDGIVYCIGPNDEYLWKFCCNSPVYATPFIFQWMQNEYVVIASTNGVIYILKLSNGNVVSFCNCPGEIFSSPVVLNNYLVIGCRDNNVYCFSLCGVT